MKYVKIDPTAGCMVCEDETIRAVDADGNGFCGPECLAEWHGEAKRVGTFAPPTTAVEIVRKYGPESTTFVSDAFGTHEIHDENDAEFYDHVARISRATECRGCGGTYNLPPGYAYCNSCANRLERGGDLFY